MFLSTILSQKKVHVNKCPCNNIGVCHYVTAMVMDKLCMTDISLAFSVTVTYHLKYQSTPLHLQSTTSRNSTEHYGLKQFNMASKAAKERR